MPRHFPLSAARAPFLATLGVCALIAIIGGTLTAPSLAAEEIKSADEIIRALSGPGAGESDESAPRVRGIQPRPRSSGPKQQPNIDITVHFATNSAEIEPRSAAQIQEIARAANQLDLSHSRLFIIGHTDSRGTDRYNLDLSWRRAQAVRQALVAGYDLPGDSLVAEGKGESELLIRPELSPEDYANNRRVELRLVANPEPGE